MFAKLSLAFALFFSGIFALPVSRAHTRALEDVPQYVLDFGKTPSIRAFMNSLMLTTMQRHWSG